MAREAEGKTRKSRLLGLPQQRPPIPSGRAKQRARRAARDRERPWADIGSGSVCAAHPPLHCHMQCTPRPTGPFNEGVLLLLLLLLLLVIRVIVEGSSLEAEVAVEVSFFSSTLAALPFKSVSFATSLT